MHSHSACTANAIYAEQKNENMKIASVEFDRQNPSSFIVSLHVYMQLKRIYTFWNVQADFSQTAVPQGGSWQQSFGV